MKLKNFECVDADAQLTGVSTKVVRSLAIEIVMKMEAIKRFPLVPPTRQSH